jgi:hypothetical protein
MRVQQIDLFREQEFANRVTEVFHSARDLKDALAKLPVNPANRIKLDAAMAEVIGYLDDVLRHTRKNLTKR